VEVEEVEWVEIVSPKEAFAGNEVKEDAEEVEEEPYIKINISLVDVYRNNYLNYDIDSLIDEL
jgi:hypothetical protein